MHFDRRIVHDLCEKLRELHLYIAYAVFHLTSKGLHVFQRPTSDDRRVEFNWESSGDTRA